MRNQCLVISRAFRRDVCWSVHAVFRSRGLRLIRRPKEPPGGPGGEWIFRAVDASKRDAKPHITETAWNLILVRIVVVPTAVLRNRHEGEAAAGDRMPQRVRPISGLDTRVNSAASRAALGTPSSATKVRFNKALASRPGRSRLVRRSSMEAAARVNCSENPAGECRIRGAVGAHDRFGAQAEPR